MRPRIRGLPAKQVAGEIGLMTVTVLGDLIDVLVPAGDERRAAIIARLRVASAKLSVAGAASHEPLLDLLIRYLSESPSPSAKPPRRRGRAQ